MIARGAELGGGSLRQGGVLATARDSRYLASGFRLETDDNQGGTQMMEIVAFLAGYAFALVGGYFCVGAVVGLLWKLDPHPHPPSPPQGSRLIGLVERALYVTVIVIGREGFIVVWLAMKVVTDWRLERHRGRPPKLAYNTFLIGTGLSLLFAVAGAIIVRWGLAEEATQWWYSLYLAIGLLLGVGALRQILVCTLKPKPAPPSHGAAMVAEQAESVNALLVELPVDAESEGAGEDGQAASPDPVTPTSNDGADEMVVEIVPQRRARRTPEEIEELNTGVVEYLRANPWQGVNELAAALGTESRDLRRPLHLLLTNRKIRKRGQGRTTEYRTGAVRKRKTKKKSARGRKR